MITMANFGNEKKGGRLGNQLFQLCSMMGLAQKYNHDLRLPQWKYAEYFDVPEGLFGIEYPETYPEIKEECFHYDQDQFSGLTSSIPRNIVGYLQSEKYFGTFKLKFKEGAFAGVPDQFKDTIAVHVRRGDYLQKQHYHIVLPDEYYTRALSSIEGYKDKQVLFFSDDHHYCNYKFKNFGHIMVPKNPVEDMFIMSLCDHHILSASTFGWWGAYLSTSTKSVLYPKKYLVDPLVSTKDFWPQKEQWKMFNHE